MEKKYSSNESEQKKNPIIKLSDEDLQNAYVNPNFQKKQQVKAGSDNKIAARRPSDSNINPKKPQ